MRWERLLVGLLAVGLLAAPVWAEGKPAEKEGRGEEKGVAKDGGVTVHVTATGEGVKGGKPKVQVKTVRVQPGEAGEVVVGKPTVMVAGVSAGAQPADAAKWAWVGIRVSPVPAALDAHLGLKGKGVMVGNIVKGSPADKAGLDRYDVIVGIGKGKPVESSEQFVADIRGRKQGEKVQVWVMRKGKKKPVSVTLGKMPASLATWEYLYEEDPDEQWTDELKLHQGLMRRGPHGWTFQIPKGGGIGVIPKEARELLKQFQPGKIELPKMDPHALRIVVDGTGGAKKSFKISRSVDGETIEIESTDGREITVRKSKAGQDGKSAVTKKYKDADELRKKDPEAHKLYQSVNVGGTGGLRYQLNLTPDMKPLVLPEAAKAAGKQIQEQMKQWAEKAKAQTRTARYQIARAVEPARVRREFEVDENQRIRVHVCEGDTEAKLTFKDAEEMKAKAPKLYKAYEKLLKGE